MTNVEFRSATSAIAVGTRIRVTVHVSTQLPTQQIFTSFEGKIVELNPTALLLENDELHRLGIISRRIKSIETISTSQRRKAA